MPDELEIFPEQQETDTSPKNNVVTQHNQNTQALKHVDMINPQLQTGQIVEAHGLCESTSFEKIRRKRDLCPTARKFYEKTLQLRKEIKRLKKIIADQKQSIVDAAPTSSIMLEDNEGTEDETAIVRQQFVQMIIRNDKIVPKVISKFLST